METIIALFGAFLAGYSAGRAFFKDIPRLYGYISHKVRAVRYKTWRDDERVPSNKYTRELGSQLIESLVLHIVLWICIFALSLRYFS